MILREWRAEVCRDRRDEYVRYVERTGLAAYRAIPGNLGASVAVRDLDDARSEIVTLSYWQSLDAIAAFAGEPIDTARYFPEDDGFLLTRPEKVVHYEVAEPTSRASANDHGTAEGGCGCGAVRFVATGKPLRAGLCHCMTCRKAHASAFNPFVVFGRVQVRFDGRPQIWQSSPDYRRTFCPACGSRLAGEIEGSGEIELSIGSFDQPGRFVPEYESWVCTREPWLPPLPVEQHLRERTE